MPNCFQLIRKTTGQPETLNKVDEEICQLLGREVHPKKYCFGWYNLIGFELAMGKSFEDIRQEFAKMLTEDLVKETTEKGIEEAKFFWEINNRILDFLDENFTPTCWYESKR